MEDDFESVVSPSERQEKGVHDPSKVFDRPDKPRRTPCSNALRCLMKVTSQPAAKPYAT